MTKSKKKKRLSQVKDVSHFFHFYIILTCIAEYKDRHCIMNAFYSMKTQKHTSGLYLPCYFVIWFNLYVLFV